MRGAVDLSTLAPAAEPPAGNTGSGYVRDMEEADFNEIVAQSMTVPVVLILWAPYSPASKETASDLAALAEEFDGRFLLVRVDGERAPGLRMALQAQAFPKTIAIIKGEPVPLFDGNASADQMRPVIEQVLQIAAANGLTGRVEASAPSGDGEPAEPELPPLHQAAFDAIEQGDFAGAHAAFEQALAENPRDEFARVGQLQVGLLERTSGADPQVAFEAAKDLDDLDAQLAAADLELAMGRPQEAFGRLLSAVKRFAEPDRSTARTRLIEFFDIVGADDEGVRAARQRLAMLLS